MRQRRSCRNAGECDSLGAVAATPENVIATIFRKRKERGKIVMVLVIAAAWPYLDHHNFSETHGICKALSQQTSRDIVLDMLEVLF